MEKLIVPVYLNQRLVFDLLAMLQGGISTVTTVSSTESNALSKEQKVGVSTGLGQALAGLLRVEFSGDLGRSSATSGEKSSSEERTHTPASLFYKLRNIMKEEKIIREIVETERPQPGDFVEFEAVLRKNPIVETLDAINQMLDLAVLFGEYSGSEKPNKNKSSGNELSKIQKQVDTLSQSLRAGDTIDLMCKDLAGKSTAVVTLETTFLNDPLMSDLVDGNFHVLGKVIRTLKDSNDHVNLMRKTSLSKLPSPLLAQAINSLALLGKDKGFQIPELIWEVHGPGFQILPIAIYA